ncbi:BTAD domain-containing putative transcriptional regulator [Streptomyces shenzhenensis]|uniref:AfsR/SARP family transcriptional regulator n=1 Tax=Streptomyces shenzhenensis TaxID=943815 RepID=UPI00380DFFD0
MPVEFHILGPIQVVREGRLLSIGGSKPKSILAALLLAEGKVVSNGQISEALWGAKPPATMRAQIHTYVSRLRKVIGPDVKILRWPTGYVLPTESAKVDYTEFMRLSSAGHAALLDQRYEEASSYLGEALTQWRGSALGGVTSNLADAELPRLNELRITVFEQKAEADLGSGRHGPLLTELTELVERFPVRERLRSLLMTALYRSGRQAEALAVYREGRKVLAEDLGVDPSPSLNAVFQAILNGDPELYHPPLARPLAVRPRPTVEIPARIPPDLADFIGREDELRELADQLSSSRVPRPLVISGMAGSGKSALAVRAAHQNAAGFPNGQLHADFATEGNRVRGTYEVLGEVLRAIEPSEALPDTLIERVWLYRRSLAGRKMLILLDNVPDVRRVIPFVPGSGESRVIVTSRSCLVPLEGAHFTRVGAFAPAEAVELVSRIVGADRVAAEPGAAKELVELCDWLPLAVRVAATRLVAKPHWLIAHLVGRMADTSRNPLDELRIANLDVRSKIELSLGQLPEEMGSALGRLALLPSGQLSVSGAALALSVDDGEAEDTLEYLVEHNLLSVSGVDEQGNLSYYLPRLIWAVAMEKAARLPSSPWRAARCGAHAA